MAATAGCGRWMRALDAGDQCSGAQMDNDFLLDYDEITKTIKSAEVITIRFVVVSERLLIDYRSSDADPPLVKLVERAATIEDRFRGLKKLRPRFRLPERINAIWWPKYVDRLVERGIWDAMVQRIVEAGFPEVERECDTVLEELRASERQEIRNALIGEGFQSLWGK
jgi:hypothetical protein